MKVLITGGAGFVGRYFTKHYLEAGDDVVCVDPVFQYTGGLDPENWPFFDPRDFKNFTFLKQDCREFFKENNEQFDLVLHLAAMVGGRLMIDFQPLAVAEDLAIDAMFWRWAEKTMPKKSVYFSSSAAYPIKFQKSDHYLLLKEDMIDFKEELGMPDMTYGWAKLTGEYLGRLAFERYGLNTVSYRPFSGYGPDQDLTYPFPAISKRLLEEKNNDVVRVWGTGRQMRDFVHIEDCVRCVLATMNSVSDGSAINISSGRYTSFIELAQEMLKQIGSDAVVEGTSDKPEGVFARGGDQTLQKQYGFTPNIPLEKGVEAMLKYWSSKS